MISFRQAPIASVPPKPVSPHYEQVAAEAKQWLSDGAHLGEYVIENLVSWKFELLVCTAYPGAGASELRTCTDFLNIFFLLDDLAKDVDYDTMEAVARSVLGLLIRSNQRICSGRWFESKLADCLWRISSDVFV
jgi:hypothetical protein